MARIGFYENPSDILSCIKRVEQNFLVKYRDSHAMHLKFLSVAVLGEVKGIILLLKMSGKAILRSKLIMKIFDKIIVVK